MVIWRPLLSAPAQLLIVLDVNMNSSLLKNIILLFNNWIVFIAKVVAMHMCDLTETRLILEL